MTLPPRESRIHVRGEPLQFVPARNFRPGRVVPVRLVVLHSMEAPELTKTAESVAGYFKTQPASGSIVNGKVWKGSSAHVCVDSDSAIQCVRMDDTAWAAPPCNPDGFHVELAGYAKQTTPEWVDDFSIAMLVLAAEVCAAAVMEWEIPILFRDRHELAADHRRELRGFTTHEEISFAFGKTTHRDPGAGFPMDTFLAMVRGSFPFGGLDD